MSEQSISKKMAGFILDAVQLAAKSPVPEITVVGLLGLLDKRLGLVKGRVLQKAPGDGQLHVTYAHGLSQEEIRQAVYAKGEGLTGKIMTSGQAVVVADMTQEIGLDEPASGQQDGVGVTYIAVPVIWDDGVVAILAAQSDSTSTTDQESDRYVMQVLAALIAQVLCVHRLVAAQVRQLSRENKRLRRTENDVDGAVHGIVGNSPALRRALVDAEKAASSSATVMLIGESGCGKERFSRMIHLASDRRDAPFVCINCAAIPQSLIEAELFGHEKGSFTGATAMRKGTFEMASGGTLFLDEIGEMPVDLQAKLLRVLQEKTVQRIGSSVDIAVDVRIICATNKQLEDAIKQGQFRLDLYYRLNVVPIHLPPLRERAGDIELLALYFLARYNQQQRRNVILTPSALQSLERYEWPGNVRQLENVIERLVIMSDEEVIFPGGIDAVLCLETAITLKDLQPVNDDDMRHPPAPAPTPDTDELCRPYRKVDHNDRAAIIAALRQSHGNKTHAARRLGLSTRQLHYRLTKLQIDT